MSKLCSLNAAIGSDSGLRRGLDELFFLRECNDDVKAHLATCHVSQLTFTWKNLILTRVGLSLLSELQIGNMLVCPKHSLSLWSFGNHRERASILLAEEIRDLFGQDTAHGSRD